MKSINTLLLLLFAASTTLAQSGYTVNGTINVDAAVSAYLYLPQQNGSYTADSCNITAGRFSFSGSVPYPVPAILQFKNHNNLYSNTVSFYLENATITADIDLKNSIVDVSGSHTQDLQGEFMKLLMPLIKEMNSIQSDREQAYLTHPDFKAYSDTLAMREQHIHEKNSEIVYQFVKKHPADFISIYLLKSQLANAPNDLRTDTAFAALSGAVANSPLGSDFAGKLQKVRKVSIGALAPDFDCRDIDGNPVKLSDFRGKYLLLQFWASDCSNCLDELPNLTKTANLTGKNFAILAIAVDPPTGEEQWKDYVKTNKLPWVNVFDEQINGTRKLSVLYDVNRTPTNFLLDKEGKIIAKELFGNNLFTKISGLIQPRQDNNNS